MPRELVVINVSEAILTLIGVVLVQRLAQNGKLRYDTLVSEFVLDQVT